jgi:hypothetical protein
MVRKTKILAMLVVVLGIIGILAGGAFIGLAVQKNDMVTNLLREQKITTGLTKDQIAAGQIVDTPEEVQAAADTIAQHMKGMAPSYAALMANGSTGKFDPTNPQQLSYGQGMNIANSLNLVILGYGVIQETMGTGAVLIVLGLGITVAGALLFSTGTKTA